ncbi:MAG: DUF3098 domain-containing protein [Candidatus Kapaibacteriota bacterium]|jgi:hypothetical protein
MSKKKVVSSSRKQQRSTGVQWNFPLTKTNFLYFGAALGVIIIGYLLMATGITSDPQKYLETWANSMAIVVAPTLLVIAYCILIPLAIMKSEKAPSVE